MIVAKTQICDVCKFKEKKIVECSQYFRVKNQPTWRIDTCKKHNEEVGKLNMHEYVRLVYEMKKIKLSDEEISERLKR